MMRSEHALFLAALYSLARGSHSLSTVATPNTAFPRPALKSTSHAYRSAEAAGIHIAEASEGKGLGAFSTARIPFGTLVGFYTGETLTLAEVQARYWGKLELDDSDRRWMASRRDRNQGVTGHYIFEMKDGTFIDAEDGDKSGWCRFMNHANEDTTECNIKAFDQVTVGGEYTSHPYFYAIRDIEVGEELCFYYGECSGSGTM